MRNISLAKFSFILLLLFSSSNIFALQQFEKKNLQLNNKTYQLEIADTRKRKSQGLMYRETLASNAGMLFIYQRSGNYRFWMKNTLIPLLVIWLDENAQILGKQILQPCKTAKCPSYGVSMPSRYIVELHPDEYDRFKQGDTLPEILSLK